jgi:predicted DCC family thiol-disulfide oxidoreductase YuxK
MADAIVLYDSDCGFCRWALSKLLAWDRAGELRPVALQEPEAARLLADMEHDERMASWHLVADGEVRSAGAAFEPLLRRLPAGRPLAATAGRFPAAVERAYRFVAGRRGAFGRLVTSGAKRRAGARIASRESASGRADSPHSR